MNFASSPPSLESRAINHWRSQLLEDERSGGGGGSLRWIWCGQYHREGSYEESAILRLSSESSNNLADVLQALRTSFLDGPSRSHIFGRCPSGGKIPKMPIIPFFPHNYKGSMVTQGIHVWIPFTPAHQQWFPFFTLRVPLGKKKLCDVLLLCSNRSGLNEVRRSTPSLSPPPLVL